MYANKLKKAFNFEHCWRILRRADKWGEVSTAPLVTRRNREDAGRNDGPSNPPGGDDGESPLNI